MISIVIVEDNEVFREGIAAFLNATEGFRCVKTFDKYETMLKEISAIKPDVLISDINLPGMSGIEGVKEVKKILPELKIIMLTIYEDDKRIFDAIVSGASGYLSKKTSPAKIIEAVKEVSEGGSPMNSEIAGKVIRLLRTKIKSNSETEIQLSEKEKLILESMAEGKTYKAVADELFISIHTVRYHIKNIYDKLHAHSQSEAIAIAYKKGLI
jgi:DNA-binding NarL/FixJ family response regulator